MQAFFANFAAATPGAQRSTPTPQTRVRQLHYLRTMLVLGPESLAVYTKRIGTNRGNPYFKPGAFAALGSGGLQVFERLRARTRRRR